MRQGVNHFWTFGAKDIRDERLCHASIIIPSKLAKFCTLTGRRIHPFRLEQEIEIQRMRSRTKDFALTNFLFLPCAQ